jgi:hypothetical protein
MSGLGTLLRGLLWGSEGENVAEEREEREGEFTVCGWGLNGEADGDEGEVTV